MMRVVNPMVEPMDEVPLEGLGESELRFMAYSRKNLL